MSYLVKARSLLRTSSDGSSLRDRAVGAGAWVGIGFGAQKLLQFASNLILTRILFPEAFGLMALANVFLVGLALFSDVGIKPAVIRDSAGDELDFLNTAWSIQVLRGVTLFVAGLVISYPVSVIYRQPILFPLLAVLSATALIAGFDSIGFASAERKLDFKHVIIAQLLSQTVSIVILITTSYLWRSVWALAISNVLGAITTLVVGHAILSKHRHRLVLRSAYARSILVFGRWILLATLATYLGGEGLRALQGWLISPAEFGILTVAYAIAAIPNDLTTKLVGSIGLPALAETYRNNPARAFGVLKAFRVRTIGLSLLLFCALMSISRAAIGLLYDHRYAAAGTYLLLLCFANSLAAVTTSYNNALLACGRSSIYFVNLLILALIRIAGIGVGFCVAGITGMILGLAISNAVYGSIALYSVKSQGLVDLKTDSISFVIIIAAFLLSVYFT